jgi:hypothetical protein
MPPRSAARGAQWFPTPEHHRPSPPLPIKPLAPSRTLPCCSFASSPHILSPLNQADEARHFPGQQSPGNLAGAGVDGEAVGRHRPPLPAFLLHRSLPLLGLDLTLRPIPSLAEQEHHHLRRNPKVIVDEHSRTTTSSPSSCRIWKRRSFRVTTVVL